MLTAEHFDKEIIKKQIELCGEKINFNNFVNIFERANVGDTANEKLFTLYDQGKTIIT